MSFMDIETEFGKWYLVDGPNGTDALPESVTGDLGIAIGETETESTSSDWVNLVDDLRDYIENSPDSVTSVECVEKWGCRYSADGYLDCTDWVLADTEEQAIAECKEMYGSDDGEDESEDE